MNNKIIDSLGYMGAVIVTSFGTIFSSLDFAAKWIGVIGGITLAVLAIMHKIIQIANENLKKINLKNQIKEADKKELFEIEKQIEEELKNKDETNR